MTRQVRRPLRPTRRRAQSLVEFAILAPVMIIIALGGISIDSYIQAKSQLEQAVNRAALVGARDAYDSCLPSGPPGQVPAGLHGYSDVVAAFNSALTSPVWAGQIPTPKIVCTNTVQPGSVAVDSSNWASISSAAGSGHPGCASFSQPWDNGCFGLWRGGMITVSVTYNLKVAFTPFYRQVKITASAGEQIEPFRTHICPGGFPAATSADC